MKEILRASLVIARRDFVATVWSKTFLFFLIGPLFPIIFGFVFGAMGADMDREATRPIVAVIADAATTEQLREAEASLRARLGQHALPDLSYREPAGAADAQIAQLLADPVRPVSAVLQLAESPSLHGPHNQIASVRGQMALLMDMAAQRRLLTQAPPAGVVIALADTGSSTGSDNSARLLLARGGQLVLVMLTMILAGMLLSNLIEEKSNKVIEVLAAAVPVDAIFLGKLTAMLGMSLVGIAVWGTTGALGLLAFAPKLAALPSPAVGWPGFIALGMVYFTASYLLLGALFLGIGAQASTVREVQTLSMPVTMGQLVVFAFASSAVSNPHGSVAIASMVFPWSSPFAMIARAAQDGAILPHLAAILWQAIWIALIIRFAAKRFRRSVLKSGRPPRRRWFKRAQA